jgi:hypothetical protein
MSYKYLVQGSYDDPQFRRFVLSDGALLTHDGSTWADAGSIDFGVDGVLGGAQLFSVGSGDAIDLAESDEFDDRLPGEFAYVYEGVPVLGEHLGFSESPAPVDEEMEEGDRVPYPTRGDVEAVFGVENVKKWADLDDDQDEIKIAARILWARQEASDEIDDRIRCGPYVVPFESPYPRQVVRRSAILAGVILYDSRGATDMDVNDEPMHRLSPMRKQVEKWLSQILAGRVKFSGVSRATEIPKVVCYED